MVALAYDGALRREALVQLSAEDFEPVHLLIHLRAGDHEVPASS
jgi:integrase/recombinase XerD